MKKIYIAPQEECNKVSEAIDYILVLLDHPEALVTDWSDVGDFCSYDEEYNEFVTKFKTTYPKVKVQITLKTRIYELARHIS